MQRGKYIRTLEIRLRCASAQKKNKMSRPCSVCGSIVIRTPSFMTKKRISCSPKCLLQIRKEQLIGNQLCAREKSPRWKGGISYRKDGRAQLSIQGGGHKYRYREVVEKIIGRELTPTENVHHIDANKKNDEASNLFLFRHISAHQRWECFVKRHKLDPKILFSNLQSYVTLS